jgi:hypothetical protein
MQIDHSSAIEPSHANESAMRKDVSFGDRPAMNNLIKLAEIYRNCMAAFF